MSQCINVKPKAVHQKLNAQTLCAGVQVYFSGTRHPFGSLGDVPGCPPAWGPPFRPVTRVPRVLGEPGSEQPSHRFQPQTGKLDRAAARALGSRALGARRPLLLGAGMCALRAPAPPPSHVCAAGARSPGGSQHRAVPGVGERGLWAGPWRGTLSGL